MEINSSVELKEAIATLQREQLQKKALLLEQFHNTYESLKPVNFIKNTFQKSSQPLILSLLKIGTLDK